MDAPGQPLPPFPGPLGPPGEVESLLHLTLARVSDEDLLAIAHADNGHGAAGVLGVLRLAPHERRWPTAADVGEAGLDFNECCVLELCEVDRAGGAISHWRLLFVAGAWLHVAVGPSWPHERWLEPRIWQMLLLALELGDEAARAARSFIAWAREHAPEDDPDAALAIDIALLMLDAATGNGAAVDDARVLALWARMERAAAQAARHFGPPPPTLEIVTGGWLRDPHDRRAAMARQALAMSRADLAAAMGELLAAMIERREPRF